MMTTKKDKENSAFDAYSALKKVCTECTESTLKNYVRSIKRLAKLAGHDEIPGTKGWLFGKPGKALINKVKKLPLTKARHLFLGGSQAARIYGNAERSAMWSIAMNESSNAYRTHRNRQTSSETEKRNWPDQGYKVLGKAASMQKRKITELLKKSDHTIAQLFEIQKAIILLIYSHHAFRTEPSSWFLKADDKKNTLLRPRGSRKFVVTNRVHKTQKSMGVLKIVLDSSVSKALAKYLPLRKKLIKHDYFLFNRSGDKLTSPALSKLLLRTTSALIGKKIGVRMTRILKATQHAGLIEKADRLRTEMGHSAKMSLSYIRKDAKKAK
jgi:hypothetical protein